MSRSTKEAWLNGPGDLEEAEVEDVPVKGQTIRVRALPAAYSNQAQSEALEMKQVGATQVSTVNIAKLEVLQFAHGCIEPQFTVQEAEIVAKRFGPAFKKVIEKIDDLSGVNKEAIEEAQARFPGGSASPATGADANGGDATPAGSGRPAVSSSIGA